MDPGQPVVEAGGLFIDGVCVELLPRRNVIEQLLQRDGDLQRIDADAAFRLAVTPCPAPHLPEEPAMQPAKEIPIRDPGSPAYLSFGPAHAASDVVSFGNGHIAAGADKGQLESFGVVGIEWRLPIGSLVQPGRWCQRGHRQGFTHRRSSGNMRSTSSIADGGRSEQATRWSSSDIVWSIRVRRSEEHTSELQSRENLVCRLLLEKKNSLLGR